MRSLFALVLFATLLVACGGEPKEKPFSVNAPAERVDDGKGVGEITQVTLNNPLNQEMADRGKAIYEMKCSACHKLTDQRVVGPGWAGLTEIRKPEWIMNMITNVDVMLAEDPTAQKLLEECLVRMPNQNLSIGDARDVLEFMLVLDAETE